MLRTISPPWGYAGYSHLKRSEDDDALREITSPEKGVARSREPRVSVVMAAYNAAGHITGTVDSILAQTFADFELIIVDDGSTDGTAAILDPYSDPRIVRFRNETNAGVARARNRGGAAAGGEYLAVHDADDLSAPERFTKQVAFLDTHPEIGVVGTQGWLLTKNSREPLDVPLDNRTIQSALLGMNCLFHSSLMIRSELWRQVEGYDERYPAALDYDLVLRLSEAGAVANLPERLYLKRNVPGSITNSERGLLQKRWGMQAVAEAVARRKAKGESARPPPRFALTCLEAACAEAALGDAVRSRADIERGLAVDTGVADRIEAARVLANCTLRYAALAEELVEGTRAREILDRLFVVWPDGNCDRLRKRTAAFVEAGVAFRAYEEGQWRRAATAATRSIGSWPARPGGVGTAKLLGNAIGQMVVSGLPLRRPAPRRGK